MSILYIRDEATGKFVEVPALRGSDANVTAENIQRALGYVPVDGNKHKVLKNYLHNSDFTQFVAQRGFNTNHLNKKLFLGDRWRAYSSSSYTYTADAHESGGYKNVYIKGVISQIVENAPATGYAYVSTLSGTATADYAYDSSTGVGKITITSANGCVLDQAWLYDEESNAKPAKRGYSAELMDCYRYFFFFNEVREHSIYGFAQAANDIRFTIPLPVPMRLANPSFRITSLNNFTIMPGNIGVSAVTALNITGNVACMAVTPASNVTSGSMYVMKTNSKFEFCADLEPEMYE